MADVVSLYTCLDRAPFTPTNAAAATLFFHKDEGESPVQCCWGDCARGFETVDKLNEHHHEEHAGGGKSEYLCQWRGCARVSQGAEGVFKKRQKLQRHLQTHSNWRPYQCEECGARFGEATGLQLHMRTHNGEKPFACEHPGCGKRFTKSGSLVNHMRVHSGDKPFECPICHRRFAESGSLSKHKKTHSGEKPHVCAVCQRSFARSDTLTRHMKTHAEGAFIGAPASKRIKIDGKQI